MITKKLTSNTKMDCTVDNRSQSQNFSINKENSLIIWGINILGTLALCVIPGLAGLVLFGGTVTIVSILTLIGSSIIVGTLGSLFYLGYENIINNGYSPDNMVDIIKSLTCSLKKEVEVDEEKKETQKNYWDRFSVNKEATVINFGFSVIGAIALSATPALASIILFGSSLWSVLPIICSSALVGIIGACLYHARENLTYIANHRDSCDYPSNLAGIAKIFVCTPKKEATNDNVPNDVSNDVSNNKNYWNRAPVSKKDTFSTWGSGIGVSVALSVVPAIAGVVLFGGPVTLAGTFTLLASSAIYGAIGSALYLGRENLINIANNREKYDYPSSPTDIIKTFTCATNKEMTPPNKDPSTAQSFPSAVKYVKSWVDYIVMPVGNLLHRYAFK